MHSWLALEWIFWNLNWVTTEPFIQTQTIINDKPQTESDLMSKKYTAILNVKCHWKRPWCWERLRAEREGGNRGWDGWMASLTQWTWVWASSGRQGRTGKPGILLFMESQRVRHDLVTGQQQKFNRGIDRKSRRLRGKQKDYRNILFGGTRHMGHC